MHKIKRFWRGLGPGFITGASDDDPSGIATYSQTGAQFGYTQLWLTFFTLPLMTAIQEMCGRIGLVTGKGLSQVIRHHYSKKILYFAIISLLIANTINIGADLGAMAASVHLLFGHSLTVWLLLITGVTLVLQVFVSYPKYAKVLKWFTLTLMAYVVTAFAVKQDWHQILHYTFIPHITWSSAFILNIVAILGTTISPYLFFWQTDEEVEEEVSHHKLRSMGAGVPKVSRHDIKQERSDTVIGMVFSQLIMFFIIITAASTLHVHGITTINTADQAAQALKPVAGDSAALLFTIGIVGTGLLAVPVLAGSASYAVSEAFGWREGLYRKFKRAHGFYGVITIATVFGLLINYVGIPPFRMLYYAAALNGIVAPPLMILILLISNNQKIMGKYTNSRLSNSVGWVAAMVMSVAAIALLVSLWH